MGHDWEDVAVCLRLVSWPVVARGEVSKKDWWRVQSMRERLREEREKERAFLLVVEVFRVILNNF